MALTTKQVAERLGVTPARVRAIARARKITASERTRARGATIDLWDEAQLEALRPGRPGRPAKNPDPRKDA